MLAAVAMVALLGSIHVFPSWWPLVAASGAALIALLLVLVAPLVLEPLFNKFAPLERGDLADGLLALARRAHVPVARSRRRREPSHAQAQRLRLGARPNPARRSLRHAARRRGTAGDEIVVAHELGHRRHRDVAKGTLLVMASFALGVLLVWPLDPTPRRIPVLLFVWGLLELVTLPLTAAFSRRAERRADRFALELTRDPGAFEAAFRRLATANLSDLDPPRLVYALLFTHPTPPERMAAAAAATIR